MAVASDMPTTDQPLTETQLRRTIADLQRSERRRQSVRAIIGVFVVIPSILVGIVVAIAVVARLQGW